VLAPNFVACSVFTQPVGTDTDLGGDELKQRGWYRFQRRPGAAGIAEKPELNCKAQAVPTATTLCNQVEVRRSERVLLCDLSRIGW
jgi:hypothetical protein